SLLWLSALPHPPTSTLFPYTTLFRSGPVSGPGLRGGAVTAASRVPPPTASTTEGSLMTASSTVALRRRRTSSGRRSGECAASNRDRKSTRLNSSHQIISYAVFCLKQK